MSRFSDAITAIKQGLGDRLCIMGHHYQHDDVVRHCDVTGDSLELARRIEGIDAEHIVFCGVYFMGESAALLAKPGQSVHMPAWDANCMMSLMTPAGLARTVLLQLQATGRKIVPLAYVNTTLALKAVVGEFGGAVCTSANARTMLAWALEEAGPDGAVLFMPDKHLGRNTGLQLGLGPDDWHVLRLSGKNGLAESERRPGSAAACRRLLLWPGCCAIHGHLRPESVQAARAAYPGCRVLAHPECRPKLIGLCDGSGSTSYLIKEAEKAAGEGGTLIIGTETNLVHRLRDRFAGRCRIEPLAPAICPDMAKVTEENLLACLQGVAAGTAPIMTLQDEQLAPARASLTRMLQVCAAQR